MPIAQMKTNFKFSSDEALREFLDETALEMSDVMKKPIPAVMIMLDECRMYMNRSEDTVFFAEFRYILPMEYESDKSEFLKLLADRMLTTIRKHTQADPYHVYMQFTEMSREGAWRYTG